MNKQHKFEQWAQQQLSEVMKSMIIEDGDNSWFVFGKYHIVKTQDRYQVQRQQTFVGDFAMRRSALSFCIAENNRNYSLSQSIMKLDQQKEHLEADIECRRGQVKKSRDAVFREIVETKVQGKMAHYKQVSAELEKCINLAKYLQLRGFSNETARSGRA